MILRMNLILTCSKNRSEVASTGRYLELGTHNASSLSKICKIQGGTSDVGTQDFGQNI